MTAWTPEDRHLSDIDGWQRCECCDSPIDYSLGGESDVAAYERSQMCKECDSDDW